MKQCLPIDHTLHPARRLGGGAVGAWQCGCSGGRGAEGFIGGEEV